MKEVRFGPQTDDHDYNFQLKHAIGFLQEGSRVKAYVFSKAVRFSSRSRAEIKHSSCALPTTAENMAKWSRCPIARVSA